MVSMKCLICKWEGVAEIITKDSQTEDGIAHVRSAICPKCGSDLWSETLNGNENNEDGEEDVK